MRSAKSWAALALAVTSLLSACGGDDDDNTVATSPVQRQTTFGAVVGADDSATSGTYAWLGVPFAAPPVGDMRWRAPADPAAWTAPLATQKFGNSCAQTGRIFGPGANNTFDATIGTTLNTVVGSEDCLTLNIWSPKGKPGDKLPVFVFVFGGSNVSGATVDTQYNGANLARTANAVVVTLNYRLGVLGFFNLAQLKVGESANTASGNFALLDQLQALKFVKENIANFGGDPGNVTLAGQSAGAIDVLALVASPLGAGMFHKAIPISGGLSVTANLPAGSFPSLNGAAAFAAQANALLANLLIADGLATDLPSAQAFVLTQTPQQIASYMRGKSATTLLDTVRLKVLGGSGPIPEGTVVPTNPVAAIMAGNYNKVPVLGGGTLNEGKLFPTLLPLLPGGGAPGFIIPDSEYFARLFDPALTATTQIEQVIHPS
jgi:para-nitrobenzyl esterase